MVDHTSATPVADVAYVNGAIYTVNPGQPWADAMAIGGRSILAIGT